MHVEPRASCRPRGLGKRRTLTVNLAQDAACTTLETDGDVQHTASTRGRQSLPWIIPQGALSAAG